MLRVVLIVEDEFRLRADAVGFMEDLGFVVYGARRRQLPSSLHGHNLAADVTG
jgi:hypothetical protein